MVFGGFQNSQSDHWESDLAGSGVTARAERVPARNFTKLPYRGRMKRPPFEFEQVNSRDRGRHDRTMEKLSNPNGERACVRARAPDRNASSVRDVTADRNSV